MPNIEKLNIILKKLQELMHIQDWDIKIKLVNKYEMKEEINDDDAYGLSIRNINLKKAKILLNIDHHPEDWYTTLIHELKHVQSSDMLNEIKKCMNDRQFNNLTYYEQLIEILAKEFVEIYPESKFKEIIC